MDPLRVLSVAISLSEACVLMAYYIPLATTAPYWEWVRNNSAVQPSAWENDYVSDLLVTDSVYRHLMTCLVGLQLIVCALFVWRINQGRGSCLLVSELLLMVVSWIGWNMLTARYRNDTGEISVPHFVGTTLFIAANSLYFLLMVYNVWDRFARDAWSRLDDLMLVLAVLSFVLCLLAGVYFVTAALRRVHVFGWLFEHAAFVFFVSAHLFIFVLEGLLAVDGGTEVVVYDDDNGLFKGVRITQPRPTSM